MLYKVLLLALAEREEYFFRMMKDDKKEEREISWLNKTAQVNMYDILWGKSVS